MSVRSNFRIDCPNCRDDNDIVVTFTGWCRLMSDGSDDVGDHEWNDASPARCYNCDHVGTVAEFRIPEWSREFSMVAESEGWDIFDSSDYGERVERYDEAEIFVGDLEATLFVMQRASYGGVVHLTALRIDHRAVMFANGEEEI